MQLFCLDGNEKNIHTEYLIVWKEFHSKELDSFEIFFFICVFPCQSWTVLRMIEINKLC